MDCRDTKEYLDENFLATGYNLPFEIARHLEECNDCQAHYEELSEFSKSLSPMTDIAMTSDEAARFEGNLAEAIEAVERPRSSYVPENKIFSIARLALAAAAVLVMMVVSYGPDFSSTLALWENTDDWQLSQINTEDMAMLLVNGEFDLLLPELDDESVVYLTESIQPGPAEDILESLSAEELEWLMENVSLEI